MNKISFGIAFMCIFALTHQSAITAIASDLSPSLDNVAATKQKEFPAIAAASSSNIPTTAMTTNIMSARGTTIDLYVIEKKDATQQWHKNKHTQGKQQQKQRRRQGHRQSRSLFYTYPFNGGYTGNIYSNYGGFYKTIYSYFPSFYKFFQIFKPYQYGGGYAQGSIWG